VLVSPNASSSLYRWRRNRTANNQLETG